MRKKLAEGHNPNCILVNYEGNLYHIHTDYKEPVKSFLEMVDKSSRKIFEEADSTNRWAKNNDL